MKERPIHSSPVFTNSAPAASEGLFLALQAAGFQLFPQILLLVGELAGKGFHGDGVLSAEVAPKNETQIELSGFIRDSVVDFWFFLSIHGLHFRLLVYPEFISFSENSSPPRKTANDKGAL